MAVPNRFTGHTMVFRIPDIDAGLKFYTALFGRPPDFSPYADFHEWELLAGCWFQIGAGETHAGLPIRFGTVDIEAEVERMQTQFGIVCDPIDRIEGLVAYCNFRDPWGNRFGFYEEIHEGEYRDLVPSASPAP